MNIKQAERIQLLALRFNAKLFMRLSCDKQSCNTFQKRYDHGYDIIVCNFVSKPITAKVVISAELFSQNSCGYGMQVRMIGSHFTRK